jgi:hypothetical protein
MVVAIAAKSACNELMVSAFSACFFVDVIKNKNRLNERICANFVNRVKKILTQKNTTIMGIDSTWVFSQEKNDSKFIVLKSNQLKDKTVICL